jgi:hypothetical protein
MVDPPVEVGAVQVAVALPAVVDAVNLGAVGAPGATMVEEMVTAFEVDAVAAVEPANLAVSE